MIGERVCTKCDNRLPDDAFRAGRNQCRSCTSAMNKQWRLARPEYGRNWKHAHLEHSREWDRAYKHRIGQSTPMGKAVNSSAYLGVYVAERALSKFFDHIERMPFGNPGYDFVCGKGYKIDVKSSCFNHRRSSSYWIFQIRKNAIADYFLCLAFDDRESLTPLHVWLIPGNEINTKSGIGITNTDRSLAKHAKYERPLDRVITRCSEMRSEAIR
jgi:hypothetical protein